MKKKKSILPGLMLISGMGVAMYMIYKKNPNIICDMKNSVKETAYKLADSLEDMTEDM